MTLESGSEIKSGTIPINALDEGFKLSERVSRIEWGVLGGVSVFVSDFTVYNWLVLVFSFVFHVLRLVV